MICRYSTQAGTKKLSAHRFVFSFRIPVMDDELRPGIDAKLFIDARHMGVCRGILNRQLTCDSFRVKPSSSRRNRSFSRGVKESTFSRFFGGQGSNLCRDRIVRLQLVRFGMNCLDSRGTPKSVSICQRTPWVQPPRLLNGYQVFIVGDQHDAFTPLRPFISSHETRKQRLISSNEALEPAKKVLRPFRCSEPLLRILRCVP